MQLNQENYMSEVKNRVGFYSVLSHESPEVRFKSFKVYRHPETPKQHFLHLKYVLLDKEDETLTISVHEEIETFVRARAKAERGWLCVINQNDPEKIAEFLKEATIAEDVKVDQINIRGNDDQKEV